jgi:replicative DNA helicase
VRGDHNHAIAIAAPLDLPAATLPVDPYVLGCWEGDGHARSARITIGDSELLDHLRAAGVAVRPAAGNLNASC